jgi:hypothetical protein
MMTPYRREQKKIPLLSPLAWSGIVLGLCVLGLVLHNTHDVLFGAKLTVKELKDGGVYTEAYLPITGKTRSPKRLTINDRPITTTKDGYFNEAVILSEGYNRVRIELVDRFGKIQERTYHLVLEKQDSSLAKK